MSSDLFRLTIFLLIVHMATSLTHNRIALVTGANKGIGKEIARKIGSQENWTCIIGCRDKKLGLAAAEELRSTGCNVSVTHLDLNDLSSISATRSFIEQEFGRLDVLVNNAAVCFNDPTLYGKVAHTPFKEQASISIYTNFFGTLGVINELLPLLRNAPSPRLINIASSAGRLGILRSQERVALFTNPDLRTDTLEGYMRQFVSDVEDGTHAEKGWANTCYGMSKLGIIALTKILAREAGKTMMVNSVDPGYCATDQNNNQGHRPAERGAVTPFLLATLPDDQFFSGLHWFDEHQIDW